MTKVDKHLTTSIVLLGKPVDIDTSIVKLIQLLNQIPGVSTRASCENGSVYTGGNGRWVIPRGYVSLDFSDHTILGYFCWNLFVNLSKEMRHSSLQLILDSQWISGRIGGYLQFLPEHIKKLEYWIQKIFAIGIDHSPNPPYHPKITHSPTNKPN